MPIKSNPLIISLVLLAGIGGYSLGNVKPLSSTPNPVQTTQNALTSQLFQTQTATLEGQIIKINPTTVTVQNKAGKQADFPLSKKFVVYKSLKTGSFQATASSNINLVEKNKTVLVMFEYSGNKYQVISVSDLPKITKSQK